MTGPGFGVITVRVDHDLVGRVLAAKLRLRARPLPAEDSIRLDAKRAAR